MPYLDQTDGRVVFVASGSGPEAFSGCSEEVKRRVVTAGREELAALAAEFVSGAEAGAHVNRTSNVVAGN